MKIYIYNNWHNGDVLTNRCLIMELMKHERLDIVVGSYRNRHYLVSDLPVKHIIADCDEETPHSKICLSSICPPKYIPINSWCGTFPDIDKNGYHNWRTIADTFNRQSEQNGIGIILGKSDTPMLDFRVNKSIMIRGRGVYVENGPVRSGHCSYNFDMNSIGSKFPELNFYCTSETNSDLPNIINCGSRNLIDLSLISNKCEAIIGKGSGPLICTFTEPNRYKPRAVVGYKGPTFWEYRDSPMRYLKPDELENFLEEVKNQKAEIV